ncbi:MAG: cell wall hydrolase [Alphaproteobacteria bacterium]|nr:cell wall hydrolase [Alphaproteobacteria bacterium]
MKTKTRDVLGRSDRVLIGALAVILCAASAAVGAASSNHPSTENASVAGAMAPIIVQRAAVATVAPAAVAPSAPAVVPMAAQASAPTAAQPASAPVAAPAKATGADLAMTQLLAEHRCLSEVMYYEARGEGRDGQMAVAEVVFHRLRHGHYGHSICAVVYEGQGTATCQFSFACDGQLAVRKSTGAWRSAETLAARILTGEVALRDVTGDATHFHNASVSPDWADDMQRTVQIGNHVFYRPARSRAL